MAPATVNTQSACAADRARVADIEAQILNLHCSINARRIQKDLVQKRLASYKYPVLTLPNEIMSEIFTHFLPKMEGNRTNNPALWRAILLYCTGPNIGQDIGQAQIQTLEVWLARSGVCPLSIQMENYYHDFSSVEILEVIVSYRARWEYLKIHVLPAILDFVKGPMPLVRQLDIIVGAGFTEAVTFWQAPRLRSAILKGGYLKPAMVLPWSQLTSLTLLDAAAPDFVKILAKTTSLVYCELVLHGYHVSEEDIRLPCLESLVLVKMDPNDPWSEPESSYLDVFVVPSLRNLHVPETFLGPDPTASLASLISRSECELQEVRITGERSVAQWAYRVALPSVPKLYFSRAWSAWSREESDDDESDAGSSSCWFFWCA
ncbi:hypothetical protein DFH09DRAFT_1355013 [Mycena vulgaris]|nr:hypothetical protein DFH09DRAFT_1355013 [Mycena vulgaris]